MQITAQLFGHYADLFPKGILALEVPEQVTVAAFQSLLAKVDMRLANVVHCRIAVNDEYALADDIIESGSTVAILPPMSGG